MDFDKTKISSAILKAMKNGSGIIKPRIAERIAEEIYTESKDKEEISISEIEDLVYDKLIDKKQKLTAKAYEGYRKVREFQRENSNTTDEQIAELLNGDSDYWNNENSNKNAKLLTTQRDYMAGILSTDITRRYLLSPEIVQAHDEGILHFHDADYYGQNAISNCCLINLEDMLQNGTCINKVTIERPHRLITATTIATQIITAVTSSQYGGATITLTHLAPFVRESYNRYLEKYRNRGFDEEKCVQYAKEDLKKEIADSVQTFNYQINSMTTTNGQSPFLSVCMYLGETEEYKEELAMLIEEFLRQRIQGLKNEVGVYVTPAFPKLLYMLEEDNIHEDSKYWYLTVLAAQCTAKRMVPDYISEKIMFETKIDKLSNHNAYPCMGCVDGEEIITYTYNGQLYVESFRRMWDRLRDTYPDKTQFEGNKDYLYMDTPDGVKIFDTKKGFVQVKRIIRNKNSEWLNVKFSHGRSLICTPDHPFHTDKGRKRAEDLSIGDTVNINAGQYSEERIDIDNDEAWILGFILNSGYCDEGTIIAYKKSEDIEKKYSEKMKNCFGVDIDKNFTPVENYKYNVKPMLDFFDFLHPLFEGGTMLDRHIPNDIFSCNRHAKLYFLAGMIDAMSYVEDGSINIELRNKEICLQLAALLRSLGMNPVVIQNNRLNKNSKNSKVYVKFSPSKELLDCIVHKEDFEKIKLQTGNSNYITAEIISVEKMNFDGYSYDVTTDSDHFEVSSIYSYNCRSFLTPYVDENSKPKYYGRFNQGVVTLNLPDIALSSGGDEDMFWTIFSERTELCHKALQARHKRLEGTLSDVAPILWQHGAFARLKSGEKIDSLLHGGYSTLSLGYAGLYECVKYMTGHSHTDNGVGETFGLEVMQALNDKCSEWKEAENIDYSLYGSPIESTTYKFARCLKKRFGIIEGITDRDYITNSYHVPVFEEIDPFEKLTIESKFQKLSPGGAISYIECADLTHNTEAVLEVIKFIYEHIMYAELNTKSDYCQDCGYDGEIKIIEENGELIWECPNCGNRDKTKMNVARRTCGYIGSNFWNKGRTEEIKERYVHLDDHISKEDK